MKHPYPLGSILEVTFWDHCENGDSILKCRVIGELIHHDKMQMTIQTWKTLDTDCDDSHCFNIVQSAVTSITKLSPVD